MIVETINLSRFDTLHGEAKPETHLISNSLFSSFIHVGHAILKFWKLKIEKWKLLIDVGYLVDGEKCEGIKASDEASNPEVQAEQDVDRNGRANYLRDQDVDAVAGSSDWNARV